VIAAVAIALYGIIGFLVAPWIVQRQLEQRLAAALHRPVSIARVRTNPFTLSVTIDGLDVRGREGTAPFIRWDRLVVNARLIPIRTIFMREVALDALILSGLEVHFSLGPDGRLDCEDLLEAYSSGPAAPPKPRGSYVFGVDRLSIDRAQVVFVDRSRARPFQTTLGPVTIQLQHFRTRPDSTSPYAFSGTTESGERFSWSGSFLVDPLRSTGELSLDDFRITKYRPYYEQEVGFELREGRGAFRSRYQLEWGPNRHQLEIVDGEVHVRDLVLSLRGAAKPAVELPVIDVSGIRADVLGRTAEVAQISVRGGTVRARRDGEGRIDLTGLAPPASATKADGPPYTWVVRRLTVTDYRVEVEDAQPRRPVALVLAPIEVTLQDLSSDPGAASQLELAVGWNGRGRVTAKGSIVPRRPAADLRLQVVGLDLPSIDPYLSLYGGLAARLSSGQLGLDGRVRLDRDAQPRLTSAADDRRPGTTWSFEGSVGLSMLSLVDDDRGEELARWKNLEITGIKAASEPAGATIEAVRWEEPRLRLYVGEDRSTNLRRVLGAPGPHEPAQPVDARPAFPVSIATVQVVRGRAGFVDRSVRPPAVLGLTDVNLRLRNLSNQVTARSSVSAHALVSGTPLEVKGTLSPRLVNDATDLAVTAKGIDLTPLGPYFVRYVGYELEKGKLDLDLAYRVERRILDGKNVVRVDQLTLSDDKTDSPEATSLPVKLGLSILRDKDGVIDLDVPVSGNVDDPSFSLGKLVWHAIANVFAKAATAPFAALGKLFGGSTNQPLDVVDFSPGSANLAPGGDEALQTLARALEARPGLSMEIEGTADDRADGKTLRLAELRKRARLAKWKAQDARSGQMSPDQVRLSDDEYRTWLELASQTGSGSSTASGAANPADSRSAPTPTPTPASAQANAEQMQARLLETVVIPPEALRALAQQRSETVRQRLIAAQPKLDVGRLFLVHGGERAATEGGARAYFTLK
jgi:hypothetical protein